MSRSELIKVLAEVAAQTSGSACQLTVHPKVIGFRFRRSDGQEEYYEFPVSGGIRHNGQNQPIPAMAAVASIRQALTIPSNGNRHT